MANLARFPKSPHCLFCFGRITYYDIPDFVLPFHRQLRGKKKRPKLSDELHVKLLTNIPGFGKEGSVVPVAPGRMRNIYFPRQQAAYLSRKEIRSFKARDIPIERDFTFMVKKKPEAKENSVEGIIQEVQEDVTKVVQTDLLSPQAAISIISSLPDILLFHRTPITTLGSLALNGSVSVADVAEEVKAILGRTAWGATVDIGAEDITIIGKEGGEASGEADRLNMLGDFEVDIRVKGGDTMRRIVRIKAEESP